MDMMLILYSAVIDGRAHEYVPFIGFERAFLFEKDAELLSGAMESHCYVFNSRVQYLGDFPVAQLSHIEQCDNRSKLFGKLSDNAQDTRAHFALFQFFLRYGILEKVRRFIKPAFV